MDWTGIDKTSDEAISAMCFAGMAAPRLVLIAENASPDPDNAKFVADFSEMRALGTHSQKPLRAWLYIANVR